MIYRQENSVGILEAPFELKLGAEAFIVYEYYNKNLNPTCSLPYRFKNVIEKLDKLNHLKSKHGFYEVNQKFKNNSFQSNVLVGFTGSLDSLYQVIRLKELGYKVFLFYLNYMTVLGEKRLNDVISLSKQLNAHLVTCNLRLNNKLFVENSFINLFLYSLMLDCCQSHDIYYISSGDSLDVMRKTNTFSNLPEITQTFINELYMSLNFGFIKAEKVTKIDKLKKLKEYDLNESFNDCINTDKFLKINKNKIQTQYNIDLATNNCGICRKCAFYNLLKYYYLNEKFSQEYIDFCWKQILNENNYTIFNESIPLAIRIKNLSYC